MKRFNNVIFCLYIKYFIKLTDKIHVMRHVGFTLAELLIALAILGVIATFTIPKILSTTQSSEYKSIAKEAAAMVSEAYQLYTYENGSSGSAEFVDLTPYMNYIRIRTSGTIDHNYNSGTLACNNTSICIILANSAAVRSNSANFGGTAATNALTFWVDPNGESDASNTGPDKSTRFFIYHNGRLSTRGSILDNTCDSNSCVNAWSGADPPYFSWD